MGKIALLLLLPLVVVAKEQGINIQIIQDSDGASIGGDSSRVVMAIEGSANSLPRRGITGVHYLDQGKPKYFRGDLMIQDDTGDSTIYFLYHPKGAPKDQFSQLIVPRLSISHLTFPSYALSFYNGQPAARVGLWEAKSRLQPAWIMLGAASIGAGIFRGMEWKKLNPPVVKELPRNYRLSPGYEAYETHRWQEKDLARQKKKLRAIGWASVGAGIFGLGCLIEGFSTHTEVMLGSGASFTYEF